MFDYAYFSINLISINTGAIITIPDTDPNTDTGTDSDTDTFVVFPLNYLVKA